MSRLVTLPAGEAPRPDHAASAPLPSPPELEPAPSPVGRSVAATVGWLALLVLVGGVAYGAGTGIGRERSAAATSAARAALVPDVRTVAVRRVTGSVPLDLPGSVEPIETAAIGARASGYIAERRVDIGQVVAAGAVLAVIQSRELEQQVSQAEATLAQARAGLELARATARRSGTLVKQGWVTGQKYDEDRLGENARAADVKAAEAALAAVAQRRDYLTVTAPFAGVVIQRGVELGDLVSADATGQKPLFTLARTDRVRIRIRVPQDAAEGLHQGVEATVTVPELPGRRFIGKVARTARALDSASRTLLVEVDLDNPDGALAPGLYTQVHFDLTPAAPRLRLDANALIYNADGLKVAVVARDRVRLVPVAIGRDFGAEVEIAQGLAAEERVVLNPSPALHDGSSVHPVAE